MTTTLPLTLGLFLPLAGFFLLFAAAYKIGRKGTGIIACTTLFLSFACFALLLHRFVFETSDPIDVTLFQWISVPGITADFALHLDTVSLLMALIITGVGFLIHVYSIGYMEYEEDYGRFFCCMNFFVFAMLLLVLAKNLLLLFVGWEGVGLASYLLIGFWHDRPSAAAAATKAFVVNRIGDLGLLLGLLLTFHTFGTSDVEEVIQRTQQTFPIGAPILAVMTLLYFIGSIGKSAQLPLHVWLPDAMEGPTPVSALIHAATMVTAGVYLVVRMHPLFLLAPSTLYFVGAVGAATSLFAAIWASGQTDLKRVLAYSTISQLGFMFLGCGVGAFYAAMFHLTMHAFMKASLFLAAGNVVHMMHDTTDMGKMGGLSKQFTKTHICFLVGTLAMAGVPPLAAFFSKDLILEEDYLAGFKTFFYVGLIASLLTAFYLIRAYCLTFFGKPLYEKGAIIKEAPNVMLAPVMLLAFLSAVGGFLGFSIGTPPPLEEFLDDSGVTFASEELAKGFHFTPETGLAVLGAIAGISTAAYLYTRPGDRLKTWSALKQAFFIDDIYERLLVVPLSTCARSIAKFIEPKVFDNIIGGIAYMAGTAARQLQKMQSGQLRSYVAWMTLGSVFLIVLLLFTRM